jgi:hypothetical protein
MIPADLEEVSEICLGELRAVVDRSWTVPTGRLDWDVRTTVAHIADSLGFYCLHLAAESPQRLPFDLTCHRDATNKELIAVVEACVTALAIVAATSPRNARGWHFHGMADATGFVAMASSELLVHTDDALHGLAARLDPPYTMCDAVVDRLFPDLSIPVRGWQRLLWATGRLNVPGYGQRGPEWRMHPQPLDPLPESSRNNGARQ